MKVEDKVMRLSWWKAGAGVLAILCSTAFGATTTTRTAVPGSLNYVEGQASIGNQTLNSKSIGSAELEPGQSLVTDKGKAEVLLTPGVYLRLDDNSAAKMISPELTNTEVGLDKGRAMIEVDELHTGNDIRVAENGSTTQLLKTGLYAFDATHGQVQVIDGKAQVQDNDKDVTVKGGHEVTLNDPKLKSRKFDKKAFEKEDELYRWSDLRSSYLAEANADQARYVVNNWYGGPGWLGSGWYWNPFFATYTFIPGDGYLYSPFGWGFYSPYYVYGAPYYHGPRYRPGSTVIVPRGQTGVPARTAGPVRSISPAPTPHAAAPRGMAPRMGGIGGFHSAPPVSHVGGFGGPAHR